MAKYRIVHTEFWSDAKVLEEMSPEDKYFFLYILTNPLVTQIGIYQITRKLTAFEMGYSTESINSLFDRFIYHHELMKYNDNTRELAIKNWGRYNFIRGGKPVVDCVKKELSVVKDQSLIKYVGENIGNSTIRKYYEEYYDTSHDTSALRGQKEKEKEKEKETVSAFAFYEENGFGTLSPYLSDQIGYWLDVLDDRVLIASMEEAIKNNARSWKYCESILKNWQNKGLNNIDDVQAYLNKYQKSKSPTNEPNRQPKRNVEHLEKMSALWGE